jgi:SAM-dependent methyltransferase
LNPNQEIIDGFTSLVPTHGHILLLGVTAKIHAAYEHITAVDYSEAMIERVWPGNTESKQVHYDNWLTVNLPDGTFDGIVGDGSVNMLAYPVEVRQLFKRSLTWLKPGGVFACRMWTRPDEPVTKERILEEAATGAMSFTAFRRLFNMLIAERDGSIFPVTKIADLFDEMFPDPKVLPWADTSSIDAYRTSTATSWFPTRQEILDLAPAGSRFVDVGTYEIAETCPILTFTKQ